SRVRRRLLKAKSAPLLTSSLSTVPTNADSPSKPFRMSQASTATNTRRLPEKLNIPGPTLSPGELLPLAPPACGCLQACGLHLPFPPPSSPTAPPLPLLELRANAGALCACMPLARPDLLPCDASAANTSASSTSLPRTSRTAPQSSRCAHTQQASP